MSQINPNRRPRRVMTQAERELTLKRLDVVCLPVEGTKLFAYIDGYDDARIAAELRTEAVVRDRGPLNAGHIGYIRANRPTPMELKPWTRPAAAAATPVRDDDAVALLMVANDRLTQRVERLEERGVKLDIFLDALGALRGVFEE